MYRSGDAVRYGGITKRGNGYLRALLVPGVWAAARSKNGGALKERYEYMAKVKEISKKKAIAAIALRLGELRYTLLKNGSVYEASRFKTPGKTGEAPAQAALS